jgi:hypothetical protein
MNVLQIRALRLFAPLLLAAGLLASPIVRADGFFADVDDLPLMAGLREIPDSALVYDKPGGRIVIVSATGSVSRSQVLEFYHRTLPQLGWRRNGESYRRDDEKLTIGFEAAAGGLLVRFHINPI